MDCPIFISYSRKDTAIVHPLVKEIEVQTGIKCWIDLNGIESGDEFKKRIISAIDKCEIVLFMLSDSAIESEFAQKEVTYANNTNKRVVPVILDGGKLRGWLLFDFGNRDYIDINDPQQKQKLFNNLKSWLNITTNTTPSNNNPIIDEDKLRAELEAKIRAELEEKEKEEKERKAKEEAERKSKEENKKKQVLSITPEEMVDAQIGQAQRYEARKWYKEAFKIYEPLAEQGNAKAQFRLGYFYECGFDVPKNFDNAVLWYQKAAQQGIQGANTSLLKLWNNPFECTDEFGVLYGKRKGNDHSLTLLKSIPKSLKGEYIVHEGTTHIESNALSMSSISKIVLPSSLKSIGTAFQYSRIASVEFKDGIQEIPREAFKYSEIKEVILPSTLRRIGASAFYGCSKLSKITFNEGLHSIDEEAFRYCRMLDNIKFPNSLIRIGDYAFENCNRIYSSVVTIPDSVIELGLGAVPSEILYLPKHLYNEHNWNSNHTKAIKK